MSKRLYEVPAGAKVRVVTTGEIWYKCYDTEIGRCYCTNMKGEYVPYHDMEIVEQLEGE